MLSEAETISLLIGRIYDAALDPSLWTDVLQKIAGFVGGSASNLFAEDSASRTSTLFHIWGVEPSYIESYLGQYIRFNPFTNANCFLGIEQQMSVTNMMTHAEFRETRFYREWARPQGWVDAVSLVLDKSVTSYAALGIFRHERDGTVDDEVRQRVKVIAPHVRRAVLIGNVIDLRTTEATALADTLAGLAAGVILLRANASIAFANPAGQAMLDEGKLVRRDDGIFAAVNVEANRALREVIIAAGTGDAAVGRKGVAVLLSAPSEERWLAHVLPLTSGARRQASAPYAATSAVFIRKASLETPSPMETVAKLYMLTPGELRVLSAVINIDGVSAIAEALGLSEATVKTHLHHVFQKTGTSRQAGLIKLVASVTSPFDA